MGIGENLCRLDQRRPQIARLVGELQAIDSGEHESGSKAGSPNDGGIRLPGDSQQVDRVAGLRVGHDLSGRLLRPIESLFRRRSWPPC